MMRGDMQKMDRLPTLTCPGPTIRRKPLRASTTIGNAGPCPADLDINNESTVPSRIPPQRASTTVGIHGPSASVEADTGNGPNTSLPPSLQRTHTVARKPLDPNTKVRASISQPNLLPVSKPTLEETNLHHTDHLTSSHIPPSRNRSTKRLSKPPRIHVRKHSARNRLQKRPKKTTSSQTTVPHVFLLQYEQYPYNTRPGALLGAFSSFQTVTTGAFHHGAFAFSKEGVHDGTEYLSKTGRIKILPTPIQRMETRTRLPTARRTCNDVTRTHSPARANFGNHTPGAIPIDGKQGVLVAVHQSPTGIFCIGAFTNRRAAWGACRKHETALFENEPLQESDRWIDEFEMPRMRAREVGKGWHEFFVVAHRIDEAIAPRTA